MQDETQPVNYFDGIEESVSIALKEDIGTGDITAELIPKDKNATATIITREDAIVCGRPWFDEVFRQLDSSVKINWHKSEGEATSENDILVELSGPARSLLTGERTALNFLQTLMGTATTSNIYMQRIKGTNIKLLDTRKTIPGLRLAQKYAVKIGGCNNHRIGLYDAFLIKENHIYACGGIAQAVSAAKRLAPDKKVEVEVESIEELTQALQSQADIIMLDNFSETELEHASRIKAPKVKYELSGNIVLGDLGKLISNNIDYLSSGAITKHCQAIDLSMRFDLLK